MQYKDKWRYPEFALLRVIKLRDGQSTQSLSRQSLGEAHLAAGEDEI